MSAVSSDYFESSSSDSSSDEHEKKKQKAEAPSVSDSSSPSSDETSVVISKEKEGSTSLTIKTSYGARLVPSNDPLKPSAYFESTGTGAKSESSHLKAVRVKISKAPELVDFDTDVLPVVKCSLLTMSVPVTFDPEKHLLLSPVCLSDGSLTTTIDDVSKPQLYHLLSPIEPKTWRPAGPSIDVSVCVVPKSIAPKPPIVIKSKLPPA